MKTNLCKRIIPCLDVKDGRTVKGINFESLRDAGDPIELGKIYSQNGADELVFLDITATVDKRATRVKWVQEVASTLSIPFTVGGGISTVEDAKVLLENGADKVSINSAAFRNPKLINDIANQYGEQCVVVAIDVKNIDGKHWVHLKGGREKTDGEAIAWAKEVADRGAGELLLTSMDADGTKNGFDLGITNAISEQVNIPVIASGGAGTKKHFSEVFQKTKAEAALAASVFHFGEIPVPELKQYLRQEGIQVRT